MTIEFFHRHLTRQTDASPDPLVRALDGLRRAEPRRALAVLSEEDSTNSWWEWKPEGGV